jgi:hypothetical protein
MKNAVRKDGWKTLLAWRHFIGYGERDPLLSMVQGHDALLLVLAFVKPFSNEINVVVGNERADARLAEFERRRV